MLVTIWLNSSLKGEGGLLAASPPKHLIRRNWRRYIQEEFGEENWQRHIGGNVQKCRGELAACHLKYQGKGCSYIVGETWCMLCENWSGGYKGGSQEESALLPAQSAPDPLTWQTFSMCNQPWNIWSVWVQGECEACLKVDFNLISNHLGHSEFWP